MNDPEMWALIVGFFLPPIIAVIQKASWSDSVRAIVAFLACTIASLGTLYFSGSVDAWANTPKVFLLVMVTTIATYQGFWKPTGVAGAIERNILP